MAGDEIQVSSIDGTLAMPVGVAVLGKNGVHATVADSALYDQVVDEDADPTNELQDISFNNPNLSITQGSTVDLSGLDTDTQLTEAQVDAYVANNGYITSPNDADADPTNELQTLSISGNDITLSDGGGTVTVPDPIVAAAIRFMWDHLDWPRRERHTSWRRARRLSRGRRC